jgi:hypothetical protein
VAVPLRVSIGSAIGFGFGSIESIDPRCYHRCELLIRLCGSPNFLSREYFPDGEAHGSGIGSGYADSTNSSVDNLVIVNVSSILAVQLDLDVSLIPARQPFRK